MKKTKEFHFLPIILFFVATVMLVIIGTIVLSIVQDWSLLDSFYMTLITITTVGFGEVHPLTPEGRFVTMMILIGGVITISVGVSIITRYVVERELGRVFRRRKMDKEIKNLKDHVIICGAGETGKIAIKEFLRSKQEFVLIEKNPDLIAEFRETMPDILIIEGNATKDEVLQEAMIETAKGVITTLSSDTENLFVTISAKTLNKNINMVARAVDADTQSKLYQVGADHVISPNIIEGLRMASVMLRPTVVSFLEIMTLGEDIDLFLEEVQIDDKAKLKDKTLAEAKIPQEIGLIVIAIRKNEGKFLYNPKSDMLLESGDALIVLGKPSQVDKLKIYLLKGKVTKSE